MVDREGSGPKPSPPEPVEPESKPKPKPQPRPTPTPTPTPPTPRPEPDDGGGGAAAYTGPRRFGCLVIGVKGLQGKDGFGEGLRWGGSKLDPYVELRLGSAHARHRRMAKKTRTKGNAHDAVFNETITLDVADPAARPK